MVRLNYAQLTKHLPLFKPSAFIYEAWIVVSIHLKHEFLQSHVGIRDIYLIGIACRLDIRIYRPIIIKYGNFSAIS